MADILFPVWRGRYVYRESLLPLRGEDGKAMDLSLLYPAEEILEVLDATLEKRYEEGRDYELAEGCLRIPEGSRIACMPIEEYYPAEPIEGGTFARTGGGYVRFSEGTFWHERQIVVSYRHKGVFPGEAPESKLALLPRTTGRLLAGDPLRIVFFGDSITARANASAATGIAPYQADWCQLSSEALEEHYGSRVTMINTAVGGKATPWGVEEAKARAGVHKPDLMVLAFGMNDGGGIRTGEYIGNLQKIMDIVHEDAPLCEVVLVATTLPNRAAKGFWGYQKDYEEPLLKMEKTGVAVCNMTQMHETLLKRKAFGDMTGNNINHPNDFLSRVYAQTLLKTLGVG